MPEIQKEFRLDMCDRDGYSYSMDPFIHGGRMKITALAAVLIILAVLISCFESPDSFRADPFEQALGRVGLNRKTMTFDYGDMANYGGDRFAVPLFYTLHSDYFKIEPYTNSFKKTLKSYPDRLHTLIGFGSSRINEGVRRGLIGDPLEQVFKLLEEGDPLLASIAYLHRWLGQPLKGSDIQEIVRQSMGVPDDLQKLAALIIATSVDTTGFHERAFEKTTDRFDLNDMHAKAREYLASEAEFDDHTFEDFCALVDYKYLYAFAQDIARGVSVGIDSLGERAFEGDFSFIWETPMGKIVISGNADNTYPEDEYLLIIDAGGNDSYSGGAANISADNWISVLIDIAGDDSYHSTETNSPTFGAGVLGYAYLVDLAGNDTYAGKSVTSGVGLFGVGVLLDKSGRDIYDGYVCAQGSGQFGIGILSDLEGDDKYHAYQLAQGYGFTKGYGLLLDMNGNDDYYADTLDIVFPASQTKNYNSNLAQGVGFGKRADYIDGHSWGGGVGMLVDAAGDDTYSAGLFAQGCAYWYAVGILADDAGNDRYNGVWYVQGSGAHFGLGALIDSSGNDHYYATMNMAQGAGHDFTLGTLIDCSGDDTYDAPNLSLGGGNANGIGVFWDKSGDDIYRVEKAVTLGRSNIASRGGLRDHILCLGLFLDTGGEDHYPAEMSFASNNKLWTQCGTNTDEPLEVEKGVGFDCEWIIMHNDNELTEQPDSNEEKRINR